MFGRFKVPISLLFRMVCTNKYDTYLPRYLGSYLQLRLIYPGNLGAWPCDYPST